MKTKLITGLLTTATIAACIMPVAVHATGTTTGGDTVNTTEPTVPTQCLQQFTISGPARVTHSAAPAGEVLVDLPNCEDVEGICVEFVFPDFGPSRSPHGRIDLPFEPCVPTDPACAITVEVNPGGPARAAHQPGKVAPIPSMVVDIPQACQDVLSAVAIPTTGSDSTNILWLGALMVGLGAVLVTTRRFATVRSR